MAIDTAAKRANSARMTVRYLFIGLPPVLGIDTNDRENGSAAYIGFDYESAAATAYRIRFIHGFGIGMGF